MVTCNIINSFISVLCNLQHLILFWRVLLFELLNSTKHLMIFRQIMLNISKYFSYKTMVKLDFLNRYNDITQNPSIFTKKNI